MTPFWRGFEKAAENLPLMSDDEATEPTTVPPVWERSMSAVGPRLDELTVEENKMTWGGH